MAKPLSSEDVGLLQALGIDNGTIDGAAGAGLDANAIASGWLDDPSAFQKKYASAWDETAFASDRDGSANNGGGGVPTFQIDAPPDHGNGVLEGVEPAPENKSYFEDAMSRPPSRTQNRSPIGGPTTREQEEDDLQRALRESATEAGMPEFAPQDTGVHFGPANKDHYDANQWALVPTGPAMSAPQGPPASSKKRHPGAPALLCSDGSQHDYRLGSFLTILSEIPMARNALIRIGGPVSSYTHDSAWWTQLPEPGNAEAFYQCIHRFMAFCDSSEQSVIPIEAVGEFRNTWVKNCGFFEALLENEDSRRALAPLLHTAHTFVISPPDEQEVESRGTFDYQMMFDQPLPSYSYKDTMTLYDIFDHVFWKQVLDSPDFPNMGTQDMMTLSQVGEIFIIQCDPPTSAQATAKLRIPKHFFPERYLEERTKDAIGLQYLWKKTKRSITSASRAAVALKERQDILEARLQASNAGIQYLEERPRLQDHLDAMSHDGGDQPQSHSLATPPVSRFSLERVRNHCQLELEKTNTRAQKARTQIVRLIEMEEFLSSALTDPKGEQPFNDPVGKKYLLCGVAIGNRESSSEKTVYVCKRSEPTLIELDDAPSEQWWRLRYDKDATPVVKAETVDIDVVLNAALEMPNVKMDIGLVYASEDAFREPKIPLPEPLQRFIKFDNRSFQHALQQEESGQTALQHSPPTLPPRGRPPTPDSMDTNRASGGYADDEVDSRAGDFDDDHDPFQESEATPITNEPERETQVHTQEVYDTMDDIEMGGMSQEMEDVSTKPLFMGRGTEGRPPSTDRE